MPISTVRQLIGDTPVTVSESFSADGFQKLFSLANYPFVETTVLVYINSTLVDSSGYTVDPTSGYITFTVAPEEGILEVKYQALMFSDSDLQVFYDLCDSDDRLAAAEALDVMASTEAMIQKKVVLLDLKTDGPAVADSLRKHAATLRQTAADLSDQPFDIAEVITDVFGFREKLYNDALKDI